MNHLRTTVDVMKQLIQTVIPPMEDKLDGIYKISRGTGAKLPVFATYAQMPNLPRRGVTGVLEVQNEFGDPIGVKQDNPLIFAVRMIPDFLIADRIVPGVDQTKSFLTLQIALVSDTSTPEEELLVNGIPTTSIICGVYLNCANLVLRGQLSPSNVDNIPIGLLAALFAKTHALLDTVRNYVVDQDFDLAKIITEGGVAFNQAAHT